MSDCLFCKIIERKIPSKVVHEDADTFVALDFCFNKLCTSSGSWSSTASDTTRTERNRVGCCRQTSATA